MTITVPDLSKMESALRRCLKYPGDEMIQHEQLRFILFDARKNRIPVIDWLLKQLQTTNNTPPIKTGKVELASHRCATCSQSFNTRAALNGHQRIHRKEVKSEQ